MPLLSLYDTTVSSVLLLLLSIESTSTFCFLKNKHDKRLTDSAFLLTGNNMVRRKSVQRREQMEEATRIHPLARSSFVGVHNGVARAESNEESRGTGKSAKRLKRVPLQERDPIMFEEEDAVLTPEEKMEIERTLPFCCAQCECSDAHKRALATEGASCKCTVLSLLSQTFHHTHSQSL